LPKDGQLHGRGAIRGKKNGQKIKNTAKGWEKNTVTSLLANRKRGEQKGKKESKIIL